MAWDHPRVGGEKEKKGVKQCGMTGSPPRGRGKVENALLLNLLDRITPAWAGKSPEHYEVTYYAEDHPRVGGEKGYKTALRGSRKGSPPRGRGKGKA